ncbi:SRPBCC family protein [bacterium]|nr:SRPBCC family protein [bacterium]
MKKALFISASILMIIILITGVIGIIGKGIPETHSVTGSSFFNQSVDSIWNALTDYESYPLWRDDLIKVDILLGNEGNTSWIEYDKQGQNLIYQTVSEKKPEFLEIEILTTDIPFSGKWAIKVEAVRGGCNVTITETGSIDSSILRFVMHKIYGIDSTVNSYLSAIKKRFKMEAEYENP